MSTIELVAILADSIVALGTLGAVFYQGGRIVERVNVVRAEVEKLRDWKHDHAAQQLTALQLNQAVHEERIDEQQKQLSELRRRVGAR